MVTRKASVLKVEYFMVSTPSRSKTFNFIKEFANCENGDCYSRWYQHHPEAEPTILIKNSWKWGSLFAIRIVTVWLQCAAPASDHSQLSRTMVYKIIICRSILSRTSKQFQIQWEGWRIRIAREVKGLESYSDSPAFEMDFKPFRGARENWPTNNNFVYHGAR